MTREDHLAPGELLQLVVLWGIGGVALALALIGGAGYGLMSLAGPAESAESWRVTLAMLGLALYGSSPLLAWVAAHAFVVIGGLGLLRIPSTSVRHKPITLAVSAAGLLVGLAALTLIYLL